MIPAAPIHPPERLPQPDAGLVDIAARGSLVAFAGSFAGRFLGLGLQIAVSRLFGAQYFGLFVTGVVTVQFFRIFGSLGLAKGGLYYVAVANRKKDFSALHDIFKIVLTASLGAGILAGLVFYQSAHLLALNWFHSPGLAGVFKVLSFSVPFVILLRTVAELSRGFNTTKYAVFVEDIVYPLSQIFLFLLFYLLGWGFDAILYSFIAAGAVSAAGIIAVVWRQIQQRAGRKTAICPGQDEIAPDKIAPDKIAPDKIASDGIVSGEIASGGIWPLAREMFAFSAPFIPIALTLIGYNYVDIIMLNIFSDAGQVGVYAAAVRLAMVFSLFFSAANQIFTPLVASSHGSGNKEEIRLLFQTLTRWMLCFNLPLFVLVTIFSKPLVMVFGVGQTGACALALVILSGGYVFVSATGGVGIILTMTGHQNREMVATVAGLVLNVLLNYYLIPVWGLIGAALATTMSRMAINVIRLLMLYLLFGIQPLTRTNTALILFSLAVIGVYFWISRSVAPGTPLGMAAGGIGACVLTGSIFKYGLAREDYSVIKKMVKKRMMPAAPMAKKEEL